MNNFILPDIVFFFVSTLGIVIITFLTTRGPLTDNRRKGLLRFNNRGKQVIIFYLVLFIISALQWLSSSNRMEIKENEIKAERFSRDSLIQFGIKKGLDSVTTNFYNIIDASFSSQGHKIDSLKNLMQNQNNEVVNNYVSDQDPLIAPRDQPFDILMKNNIPTGFAFHLSSMYAPSTDFNLNIWVYSKFISGREISYKSTLRENDFMSPNKSLVLAPLHPSTEQLIYGIVYLKGNYSNLSKTKKYTLDLMYSKDFTIPVKSGYNQIHDKVKKENNLKRIKFVVNNN